MKKVENFLAYLLVATLVISTIFVLADFISIIKNFFGIAVSQQTIITIILIESCISMIAAIFFPLWRVSRYLNTYSIKKIMDYRREYKLPYVSCAIGFIGLLICLGSVKYSIGWIYGIIMTLLALSIIVWIFFDKRKENKKL